ncbi:MAG: hypothetical protein H6869_08490 [Rhodospirillales bacterium]|nr:hypothetical protein [Rhodospirillales bacterium]
MNKNDLNNKIEYICSGMAKRGFNQGAAIVYRDPVRARLALAVLSATSLSDAFKVSADQTLSWCVIGTKNYEDNQTIRNKVNELDAILRPQRQVPEIK